MASGTLSKFCLKHYRAYHVNDKRKRGCQPKLSDVLRLAFNAKRVKSLADDWNNVNMQMDPLVKRVARDLLTFRNKRSPSEYIIIKDVIGPINHSVFSFDGDAEVISFAGTPSSTSRSQRVITNGQDIIGPILKAMMIVFPGCSNVAVKLLESSPGDKAQETHTDYDYNALNKRVRSLKAFHYSALVAFEPGSVLLMGTRREVVKIPLNAMIFWRGNCPHAGGAYKTKNRRIFVSISSSLCPLTSAVYIVK